MYLEFNFGMLDISFKQLWQIHSLLHSNETIDWSMIERSLCKWQRHINDNGTPYQLRRWHRFHIQKAREITTLSRSLNLLRSAERDDTSLTLSELLITSFLRSPKIDSYKQNKLGGIEIVRVPLKEEKEIGVFVYFKDQNDSSTFKLVVGAVESQKSGIILDPLFHPFVECETSTLDSANTALDKASQYFPDGFPDNKHYAFVYRLEYVEGRTKELSSLEGDSLAAGLFATIYHCLRSLHGMDLCEIDSELAVTAAIHPSTDCLSPVGEVGIKLNSARSYKRVIVAKENGEEAANSKIYAGHIISKIESLAHFLEEVKPPQDLAGKCFGHYKIEEFIARGGMGEIWRASKSGQYYAMKFISYVNSQDEGLIDRFENEYNSLKSLKHENIVRVYEYGFDNGRHYIVMELLYGEPLQSYVNNKRGLTVQESAQILLPIVKSLMYLHQRKIIHRDIKPSNIFITKDENEELIPKLTDFGLVKDLTRNNLEHSSAIKGTPYYMAPEVATDPLSATASADIYSIGKTLAYCVSADEPYDVFPSDYPLRCRKFLKQVLARSPKERLSINETLQILIEWVQPIFDRALYYYNQENYEMAIGILGEIKDSPAALHLLAECYRLERGVKANPEKELKYLQLAARKGSLDSQLSLGNYFFHNNKGAKRDLDTAIYWFRRAGHQGCVKAQNRLGRLYDEGQHIRQNVKEAVYWYKLAASKHDAVSCRRLGRYYYFGNLGLEKNIVLATEYLSRAVKLGDIEAKRYLGAVYFWADGYERDLNLAREFWQAAVEEGDDFSQKLLKLSYESNESNEKQLFHELINKRI